MTIKPTYKKLEQEIKKLEKEVSELKRAKESLRESEEQIRLLTDQVNAILWTVDKNLRFTSSRGANLAKIGLQADEVIGKSIQEFMGADYAQSQAVKAVRQSLSGHSATYEDNFGGIDWLSHVEPLRDYNGKITGSVAVSLDISDRKQAEKEREKLLMELQKAIKEIRTLRGILPLCCFCKKIRNDKGYWEKVDVYIRKHSQADISHGVCPECAAEYYPGFYKKNDSLGG